MESDSRYCRDGPSMTMSDTDHLEKGRPTLGTETNLNLQAYLNFVSIILP